MNKCAPLNLFADFVRVVKSAGITSNASEPSARPSRPPGVSGAGPTQEELLSALEAVVQYPECAPTLLEALSIEAAAYAQANSIVLGLAKILENSAEPPLNAKQRDWERTDFVIGALLSIRDPSRAEALLRPRTEGRQWLSQIMKWLYQEGRRSRLHGKLQHARLLLTTLLQYISSDYNAQLEMARTCLELDDTWGVRRHAHQAVRSCESAAAPSTCSVNASDNTTLQTRSVGCQRTVSRRIRAECWALFARASADLGRQEAEVYFQYSLKLYSKNIRALIGYGKLLAARGRFRAAIRLMYRAFCLDCADPVAFTNCWLIARGMRDPFHGIALGRAFRRFVSAFVARVSPESLGEDNKQQTDTSITATEYLLEFARVLLANGDLLQLHRDLLGRENPDDLGSGLASQSMSDLLTAVERSLFVVDRRAKHEELLEPLICALAVRVSCWRALSRSIIMSSSVSEQLALALNLIGRIRNRYNDQLAQHHNEYLRLCEQRLASESDEEFARSVLRMEEQWLSKPLSSVPQHGLVDTQFRLRLLLSANVLLYTSDARYRRERLARIHWHIEMLKGRRLIGLRSELRLQEARENDLGPELGSCVRSLSTVQHCLRDNGGSKPIGVNTYFISDLGGLLDERGISVVATPSSVDLLVSSWKAGGLGEYERAAAFLEFAQKTVGMRRVDRNRCIEDYCVQSFGKGKHIPSVDCAQVLLEEAEKMFESAGAIIEPILPLDALRGRTLWLSPDHRLQRLPLGQLRLHKETLLEIVESLIVVPAFSLESVEQQMPVANRRVVVYGSDEWCECKREAAYIGAECRITMASQETGCSVQAAGRSTGIIERAENISSSEIVHVVAHHDVQNWMSNRGGSPSGLAQWAQGLRRDRANVNIGCVFLEVCHGRMPVSVNNVDTVGLWLLLIESGVRAVIASPLTVWPFAKPDDLPRPAMQCLAEHFSAGSSGLNPVEIARRLKHAMMKLKEQLQYSSECVYRLPTFWGAFDVVAALPRFGTIESASVYGQLRGRDYWGQ